jgi:hypothetical protein
MEGSREGTSSSKGEGEEGLEHDEAFFVVQPSRWFIEALYWHLQTNSQDRSIILSRQGSDEGPNLCTVLLGPEFEVLRHIIASDSFVTRTALDSVAKLAIFYAKKIHRLCPSLPSDEWHLAVEAELFVGRSTAKDTLHRDDYLPSPGISSEGGVAFVVLQYFNPDPIYGPELILDIGPDGVYGEVTVPQLASLPMDLIRLVIESQRKEFLRRRQRGFVDVYCPKVPSYGAVCFCDPMVFHMSPTPFGPALTDEQGVMGPGSFESVETGYKKKLLYFSDHPRVKSVPGSLKKGLVPVPISVVHGNLPLRRSLRPDDRQDDAIRNTFEVPRSFLRLTFRAVRVKKQQSGFFD